MGRRSSLRRILVPLLASALAVIAAAAWGIGRERTRSEGTAPGVDAVPVPARVTAHDPVLLEAYEPEEEAADASPTERRTRVEVGHATSLADHGSGPSVRRITGRAVGVDGAVLARARLRVGIERPGSGAKLVRTDEGGRFEWEPPPYARGRVNLRVVLEEHVASFEIPARPGEHDIGDLRFDLPPMAVTGRLFDELGPVVGVSLYMRQVGSGQHSGARARSGRDGAFTLRPYPELPARGRRYDLVVESTRHAAAQWAFEPGADLGDLRLERHGVVRGRLALDPSWPREELSVGAWKTRHWARLERDGSFELWVPPGTHRLVLGGRAWVGDAWFLTDDVEVRAVGEIALGGLDLRSELDVTRIRVVRPDGQPLTTAAFGYPGTVSRTAVGNEFVFLHRRGGDSVVVNVRGFARERVECTGRSQTVRLRSAHRIELHIQGEERFRLLHVAVHPLGSDEWTWLGLYEFDRKRRFRLDTPGVWHVWAARGRTAEHPRVELGTIHVRADVTDVQAFELTAPDDL